MEGERGEGEKGGMLKCTCGIWICGSGCVMTQRGQWHWKESLLLTIFETRGHMRKHQDWSGSRSTKEEEAWPGEALPGFSVGRAGREGWGMWGAGQGNCWWLVSGIIDVGLWGKWVVSSCWYLAWVHLGQGKYWFGVWVSKGAGWGSGLRTGWFACGSPVFKQGFLLSSDIS